MPDLYLTPTMSQPSTLPPHFNATVIILCCDECGEPLSDENGNVEMWQWRGGNYHKDCKEAKVLAEVGKWPKARTEGQF